jgi:hypothetical protein
MKPDAVAVKKRQTAQARLVDLLADRAWHKSAELVGAAGHRFGAGIHALRGKGYVITTEPEGGDVFRYRLERTPEEAAPLVDQKGQGLLFAEGLG